ncbi:hypothetical protein EXIGLDRAFT_202219 [Exidia glandulosa HHB12029]|uniref:Uncharacterized protein n=1 Tax=Exidia glandulosa HHB12029 TaxID=1314781 RepID=A0A165EQ15_EXIGL|nr:hypothetical protein EXIGLDRAFT_202219 [Exidia glandulosa HHB12029]
MDITLATRRYQKDGVSVSLYAIISRGRHLTPSTQFQSHANDSTSFQITPAYIPDRQVRTDLGDGMQTWLSNAYIPLRNVAQYAQPERLPSSFAQHARPTVHILLYS